jgi:hypothetical protein
MRFADTKARGETMFEISPVLAGKYDAADYTPPVSNINLAANNGAADGTNDSASATADVSSTSSTSSNYVDPRRYSKFDRSASQVADAPNFSFGDFLDMVNPLQHIPVVSSVYRAATGDTINPVSRVAGDIMYGGALGAISAVVGGVGAIGDAISESQTGRDKTGSVLASLFGDDKSSATTQLAQANTGTSAASAAVTAQAAVASTPQTIPQTADQNLTLASATNTAKANSSVTSAPITTADATTPLMQAKSYPLTKQAYGGVMAPPMNIEDQNRIIALSQGSHAMRLGHTIYTNPLMNGPHPLPVAAPADPTTATASATTGTATTATTAAATTNTAAATIATPSIPATAPTASSSTATLAAQAAAMNNVAATPEMAAGSGATMTGKHNPLPQNLIDDMVMMKAIGQYKGVAAAPASLGTSVDVSN